MRRADTDVEVELVMLSGVGHAPAVVTVQRVWMRWIEDRSASKVTQKSYRESTLETLPKADKVQLEMNWYVTLIAEIFYTA